MGPNPVWLKSLYKGGNLDTVTHACGEHHVKMKAEMEVMLSRSQGVPNMASKPPEAKGETWIDSTVTPGMKRPVFAQESVGPFCLLSPRSSAFQPHPSIIVWNCGLSKFPLISVMCFGS